MNPNFTLKIVLSLLFGAIVAAAIDRFTYVQHPWLMLPLAILVGLGTYLVLSLFERQAVTR